MVVLGRVREGSTRPRHGLFMSRRRRPVVLVVGAALSCSYIDHPRQDPKGEHAWDQDPGGAGWSRQAHWPPTGCVLECK